jgi:hypothetical protein
VNTNCGAVDGRVSSKQKKFLVRTQTNLNKICFGCVSICFALKKNSGLFWLVLVCFGVFRCFDSVSKQPKQTEIFVKIPKSALYENVSVCLLFVSVQKTTKLTG